MTNTNIYIVLDTQTGRMIADNLGFDKACAKCDKMNAKANRSRYRIVDQCANHYGEQTVGMN